MLHGRDSDTSNWGDEMTDIYYQLEDSNGNKLTFISTSTSETATRVSWDNEIPFVKDKWLLDQISTATAITVEGVIKVGTNRPYATVKIAYAAIRAMTSSSFNTGGTLRGGDWDGSDWTYNSAYPELGDGSTKVLQGGVTFRHNKGDGFGEGALVPITLNLKIGTVFSDE